MHKALQLRYQHSPICCSVEAAAGSGAVSILSGSAAAAGSASYNRIHSAKTCEQDIHIWCNFRLKLPEQLRQHNILSLAEYAWEFQSDALWDSLLHALSSEYYSHLLFLYALWQDERKRFEKTTKGFCAAMDKHLGLKPAKSGETQIQDVSKPTIFVQWETGHRYVVHVNCTV